MLHLAQTSVVSFAKGEWFVRGFSYPETEQATLQSIAKELNYNTVPDE